MFLTATTYCQNTHEIIFRITDPVVIKKEYPNATKVHAEITVQDLQDTLFFYYFSKYVSPPYLIMDGLSDLYREKTMGLNYVIEKRNKRIISTKLTGSSFRNHEDEFNDAISRTFVSAEQRYIRKQLNEKEMLDYDLAKYEISNESQELELFLILNGYGYCLPLTKGKYYLYFVYSYYETSDNITFYPSSFRNTSRPDESKIFRGYFISNKVRFIVE